MMKTAIVTGGAGFIGSHLVDGLIEEGWKVTAIDDLSSGRKSNLNPEASLRELDIVDSQALQEAIEQAQPSAVWHLAAQASVTASVSDPQRDLLVNVLGTLNVLQASNRLGLPVVFTSTGGALYGDRAPLPTSEQQIPEPLSPYGASKWAAEAYVRTWSASTSASNAVCRLGNVYGPRQSPHGEAGVVAIFSHRLHTGETPKLYGHGTPTRDYVHVSDVVRALIACSGRRGAFNVATGIETDVITLWSELQRIAGTQIEPELVDLRPGELQRSCLDVRLAEREVGWRAQIQLADGLRDTYEALVQEFKSRRAPSDG